MSTSWKSTPGLAGDRARELRVELRLHEESGGLGPAEEGDDGRDVLRGRLGAGHRLDDGHHLQAVARREVEERPVERDEPPSWPPGRASGDVLVHGLDRDPEVLAALAEERRARGVEAGERVDHHVDRAQGAQGVGPEVRVDERLGADDPRGGEDRVHERPELEDPRLAGARGAREALGPRVEAEAHREDEARVGEPRDVARPRLVAVGVGAGREDEGHVEPVAGHAAREVVEGEHRRGDVPLARGAAAAGAGSRRRGEHDHEEGGGGPTTHAANVSIRVVGPPARARRRCLARARARVGRAVTDGRGRRCRAVTAFHTRAP